MRFETDLVQQFGDVFVGAGNTSELLNVRVINFSSEQIRVLQAHGAIACNNLLKSAEFQKTVIDRDTPNGLLEKSSRIVTTGMLRTVLLFLKPGRSCNGMGELWDRRRSRPCVS